jgi:putative transposase
MPILVENVDLFHKAMSRATDLFGFEVSAWVVLSDHFHILLHPRSTDLSRILRGFKQGFGLLYRQRMQVRSGRVWQLRFWDHIIRDQEDFNRHIDYIHYNPVKHGYVQRAVDYPHSSFPDFVKHGLYSADWGTKDKSCFEGDFGE